MSSSSSISSLSSINTNPHLTPTEDPAADPLDDIPFLSTLASSEPIQDLKPRPPFLKGKISLKEVNILSQVQNDFPYVMTVKLELNHEERQDKSKERFLLLEKELLKVDELPVDKPLVDKPLVEQGRKNQAELTEAGKRVDASDFALIGNIFFLIGISITPITAASMLAINTPIFTIAMFNRSQAGKRLRELEAQFPKPVVRFYLEHYDLDRIIPTSGEVTDLAVSGNGKRVITVENYMRAKIWSLDPKISAPEKKNASEKSFSTALEHGPTFIENIVPSWSADLFAVVNIDSEIKNGQAICRVWVYSSTNDELAIRHHFTMSAKGEFNLSFSPDEEWLAAVNSENRLVLLSTKPQSSPAAVVSGNSYKPIHAFSWTPESKLVVETTDGNKRIYGIDTIDGGYTLIGQESALDLLV